VLPEPRSFDRLDELIDSVNAYGGSKVLVMSKAMRRQLNALARSTMGGGVYQTSTNSYGMTVHRYQDCDILTVDRDAQGVEVDDSFQVWDAASSSWVDGGSIQGPQGVRDRKARRACRETPGPRDPRASMAARRALALALTLRHCQPVRLLALGRTIGDVLSSAVHPCRP